MFRNLLLVLIIISLLSCVDNKRKDQKNNPVGNSVSLHFPNKINTIDSTRIVLDYNLEFDKLKLNDKKTEIRYTLFFYADHYIPEEDFRHIYKETDTEKMKKNNIKVIEISDKDSSVFYHHFKNKGRIPFSGLLVDFALVADSVGNGGQAKDVTLFIVKNIIVE